MRWALVVASLLAPAAPFVIGCGGSTMRIASLDALERVRAAPAAKEAATRAPEVVARAEQERDYAQAARAKGDGVAATLHAERALTAYGHAEAVARLAVAIAALADSQKALDDATAQEQSLATSRAKLDLDAQELERRTQLARIRLVPALSIEASAEREAARAAAARSLAFEARLLCGAARLVSADAPGLHDAQAAVDHLDARMSGRGTQAPAVAPAQSFSSKETQIVDDAAAARAACLDVLTRARRTQRRGDDGADALLAELSASGGWDPTRDERGVVVTLRGSFSSSKLTDAGRTRLETLGRVAAAHPAFGLQVVVHDAQPTAPNDDGDAARAAAAVEALVNGGASAARVDPERAGVRAPVVDPADARLRGRNERLDVVFVSGG